VTMNPHAFGSMICDDAIECASPWRPMDSGYVMHESGMIQYWRQPSNRRTQDRRRQMGPPNRQNVSICREIDPSPPITSGGRRGMAAVVQVWLGLAVVRITSEHGTAWFPPGRKV